MDQIIRTSKKARFLPELHQWRCQYNPEKPLDRYKFLILEGPSKVGKTRFVQSSLVRKPDEALILDCADAVVPALKGNFFRSKHTLVMFDEAHAEMVIRCKKLFQASVNKVTYGSSPTNQYVHSVWLHGIRLVIGSNVWADEVLALPKRDRQWIEDNSVYVYVDQKLYID